MAAKLIDLSFTLNGHKVKAQIAPDTMLFALLREQGCASVRCACETTNCGLCTVWLDGARTWAMSGWDRSMEWDSFLSAAEFWMCSH